MKKYLFFSLFALVLLSCSNSERLLTSATGSIYECLVVSDAACAVKTCISALECASLNVYINTKFMKDREKAAELNAKADSLIKDSKETADKVFDEVMASLKV